VLCNVFRPPEPRSGWAKARMRRSQEGDVTSCANSFMFDGLCYKTLLQNKISIRRYRLEQFIKFL